MKTFLFLVNPTLAYDPYPDWERWAPLLARGEKVSTTWNTGNRRRGIGIGDRALVVKTGVDPRGLVAIGTITSEIAIGPQWNPHARTPETGYVDLDIDVLIDLDSPVELGELGLIAPGISFTPRQSGTQIPRNVSDDVVRAALDPDRLGVIRKDQAR